MASEYKDFDEWFSTEGQNIVGHYDFHERELCKLAWIASKQDTLERLQEMLSYHDKNPWESLREMEQGLKDEIKELEQENNDGK